MLTIEDIRNPRRKSGFNHVGNCGTGEVQRWQANVYGGTASKAGHSWWGRPRLDPQEAAQDYCDYINGLGVATPATLKKAGHKYDKPDTDRDPEVEAALGVLRDARAQRRGVQGYVYLITDGEYVKIGYSVNPAKRVTELQTGNARLLSVLGTIQGTEEDERRLHAQFAQHNVLQEWFEIDSAILAAFGIDVNPPAAVQQAA